jgi:hypothetical protein
LWPDVAAPVVSSVADIGLLWPRVMRQASSPAAPGPVQTRLLSKTRKSRLYQRGPDASRPCSGGSSLSRFDRSIAPVAKVSGFSGDIKGLECARGLEKVPFLLA